MMSMNPYSAARRQLSNVGRLATDSLGVVKIALGMSALTTVCTRLLRFFGCLLRTIPNGILDLILCFVVVILRWSVTRRWRAIAHHRCRHGVGAAKSLRGGADAGSYSCYAACGCGLEYRCGTLPGLCMPPRMRLVEGVRGAQFP
jgi:hypothetical protein